ncbi:MAG: hypothetical protein HJJLKODD_00798 [Phycisphaerae bacterium]|nr:hypothetical protein [Phycisphaerae bacterium]
MRRSRSQPKKTTMYRWRPTKSQRAAFAGKMADPVMRADYIARKEAEYVDGMNLYEYVRSNPQQYTDPLGMKISLPDWLWEIISEKYCYQIAIYWDGESNISFTKTGQCPPDFGIEEEIGKTAQAEIEKVLPITKSKVCPNCCQTRRFKIAGTITNPIVKTFMWENIWGNMKGPCTVTGTIVIPITTEGFIGVCKK